MLVFGYAATLDVKNVTLSVLDSDNTQESRELISRFSASRYFRSATSTPPERDDLREGIDRGDFLAGPRNRFRLRPATAQRPGRVGPGPCGRSNSNTALVALGYLNQIGATFAQRLPNRPDAADLRLNWCRSLPQVDLEVRPWFNEGLRKPVVLRSRRHRQPAC